MFFAHHVYSWNRLIQQWFRHWQNWLCSTAEKPLCRGVDHSWGRVHLCSRRPFSRSDFFGFFLASFTADSSLPVALGRKLLEVIGSGKTWELPSYILGTIVRKKKLIGYIAAGEVCLCYRNNMSRRRSTSNRSHYFPCATLHTRELKHQTFLVPRTPTGCIFAAWQLLRLSRRSWAAVRDFKTRVLRLKPEV